MTETNEKQDPVHDHEGSDLISHLLELRTRLLHMIFAVCLVFLCLFPFSDQIYSLIAKPLIERMPEGSSMIAIDVASPFLTPFKLVMLLSIFIAIPYLLYHAWAFIAPGLYKHERRYIGPLLASSVFLFYLGAAFAYFVVFPLVFAFLNAVAPEGVAVSTDIARYLDFITALFLAFGIAFEVPIATILLISMGIVTREQLARYRPHIIVAAFIIGMFLTPPDVVSQILLALPMWALFEIGLFFSRYFVNSTDKEAKQE